MFKLVLDLFFPVCCGVCGKIGSKWICDECNTSISLKKKDIIFDVYGKNYNKFYFMFLYKDIRSLILQYKFEGKSYLCNMFSNLLIENKMICDNLKKYDIIIPVPMSKNKKSKRGYNQTELIARILANNLNIEYNSKSLIKTKNNKTQSTLSEKERYLNVKNTFEIKEKILLNNKNVILFDDILTTGATIDECSKILKEAGVKDIFVLTIAKD